VCDILDNNACTWINHLNTGNSDSVRYT